MPRGRPAKVVGTPEGVPENMTVETREERKPDVLGTPSDIEYKCYHTISNGIESLKVAKRVRYDKMLTQTLVARIKKAKNGRWEMANGGKMSPEVSAAVKKAGY